MFFPTVDGALRSLTKIVSKLDRAHKAATAKKATSDRAANAWLRRSTSASIEASRALSVKAKLEALLN